MYVVICCSIGSAAEPAEVTGVSNFGHIVSNLDKSFAFYKDLLQLDVAITPRDFDPNPAIMKMGNTIGAQSRIGVLKVPGTSFGLELIEYKDIDRKPAAPRNQDPGTGNLILLVRDIDATLAHLKQGGAKIVTPGGAALDIGSKTRGAFAQDPDGFFVALVQRDPLPQTTAPETSNVLGGLIAVTADDTEQRGSLLSRCARFQTIDGVPLSAMPIAWPWATHPAHNTAALCFKFQARKFRSSSRNLRTSTASRCTRVYKIPAPRFCNWKCAMWMTSLKTLKTAGATVVTVGGEPVDVKISTGAMLRNAIVRDPNNLYLELIQRMK